MTSKTGMTEKNIGQIKIRRRGDHLVLFCNIYHPDTKERIYRNWERVTFAEFFQFLNDIRGKGWDTESPGFANLKAQANKLNGERSK